MTNASPGHSSPPLSRPIALSTTAAGRQRDLCASVVIPCAADTIWRILTSYDRLAEIIPSLTLSRRLPHPEGEGKIRLEQVGAQKLLKLNFSARVVLDMEEEYPNAIHFAMVEGDFKYMKGAWKLEALEPEADQPQTRLSYCLTILPKRTMPVSLVESRLSEGMTMNLEAIYRLAIAANQGVNLNFSPAV
ncbi:MAG: cyclase [Synechococcales cyanobacterium RM1_1_8]|nr:cyclase [Synechococcales cyanobacterium RM1_1_8]